MSASSAKGHAMNAQRARTVEEKLDHLAKAIYELIRLVDSLESDVQRLK